MDQAVSGHSADYDLVGKYKQDEINGFSDGVIEKLLRFVEPERCKSVLDAMAGDGNLSLKLSQYCRSRGFAMPPTTVLDYSSVQIDYARQTLSHENVSCVWGDMLTLQSRDGSFSLRPGSFDRVMLKSGNHELPLDAQRQLYSNIYKLLEDGGRFINLGFLFESAEERDEFRKITRVKDSLAGLKSMVKNRHFLTREEFDGALRDAGFKSTISREPILYTLRSHVAAEHYFPADRRVAYETLLQAAQIKARVLRKNGRIAFGPESSAMFCPGEITVVEKMPSLDQIKDTYSKYPYDFLRHLEVHRDLLDRVIPHIPGSASVLDMGCALGLLRERLGQRTGSYLGVDASPEFVATCKSRFGSHGKTTFVEENLNEMEMVTSGFDVACLLNVLYQPGIDVARVLSVAHDALHPHGLLMISGPTSPGSFQKIEARIRKQLTKDELLPGCEDIFEAICEANQKLLSENGHYFTASEMAGMLQHLGFEIVKTDSIYYQTGYLVVAKKLR